MSRDVILTREGLEKLSAELEQLETAGRRDVSARIKEARDFGDISENAEYDDAKNEQAQIESRILQLQDRIRSATVVDHDDVSTDVVQVGSTVDFTDEGSGKAQKYTIVGSAEAAPGEGKLSNESPVGKALIGNRVGSTVSVTLPKGAPRKLKINKIDVGI
jgi:transcription elongation factor GreA